MHGFSDMSIHEHNSPLGKLAFWLLWMMSLRDDWFVWPLTTLQEWDLTPGEFPF